LKEKILEVIKSPLTKSFSVYGGTTLLNAAIPFLIIPILTRYMSTSDYGYAAMFTVLCSFITPVVGVSTVGAISRQYFNKKTIDLSSYIGNCFIILVLSILPVIIFFICFPNFISNLSGFPKNSLWLVLVVSFFTFIVNVTGIIWQVQSKALEYGNFQIGQTILNVLLSLCFVVFLKLGWEGRVIAQVVTVVIFGFFGFFVLYRQDLINFSYNKEYVRNALRFGIPLIPHTIGGVLMTMSDRFFITKMIGISDTGLYAVGYTFGGVIGFVENSFNLAFIPWLFERLNKNDDNTKRKIVKFTYLYFVFIISLALLLSALAPFILNIIVDEKFSGSSVFVLWIALSFAFSGMYKMVVNYIFYVEKTYILAWITFGSSMINLICTYYFIKQFGAVGAAMSASLVSFCFFVFTWLYSSKVYKMPWRLSLNK
jgi:O-antigen/teichoic acid export membrane protein